MVNREWAKKSGETWTNRKVPMSITALIFEQISGFNRKSTTRAATRDAGRERKRETMNSRFDRRFSVSPWRGKKGKKKKKEERRKVNGEKNAP